MKSLTDNPESLYQMGYQETRTRSRLEDTRQVSFGDSRERAPRLPAGPWFHTPHPVPSETPHIQPPTITEGGEHGLAPACLSSYSRSTEPGLDAQSGWRPTKVPLLLPTQWYCSSRCSTRIPSWGAAVFITIVQPQVHSWRQNPCQLLPSPRTPLSEVPSSPPWSYCQYPSFGQRSLL